MLAPKATGKKLRATVISEFGLDPSCVIVSPKSIHAHCRAVLIGDVVSFHSPDGIAFGQVYIHMSIDGTVYSLISVWRTAA
eukprot:6555325-Pyramimonas_sp.AAC.1